jgi:hypothetical protein
MLVSDSVLEAVLFLWQYVPGRNTDAITWKYIKIVGHNLTEEVL